LRKKFLIANWKMNLPAEGIEPYLEGLAGLAPGDIELVIAPPFPYLAQVRSHLTAIGVPAVVCAQSCSDQEAGAFTGEVSAAMIHEVGGQFVIVGHSERRMLFGEDDATVGRKLRTASAAGLTPVVCVGEDLEIRARGETKTHLAAQLEILRGFEAEAVVAYEPVWAIGTGQNATPAMAAEAHRFIRGRLGGRRSVLYGGSVTPENAALLASQEEVDGFLVGGASLESAKLRGIYQEMSSAIRRGPG